MPPDSIAKDDPGREPVLDAVDRVSELIFGLLMALSFTGAMSVVESGRQEVRAMFIAALGCNLAWGLVDAVMYLVRTVAARGKALTLLHAVRAAHGDAAAGQALIDRHLAAPAAALLSPAELEAMRARIVLLPEVPRRARLVGRDLLAALAVFLLVVLATFPVVIPFALMSEVGLAKTVSRVVALAMLFLCGFALGHYAGYGAWRAGIMMTVLGTVLVLAIHALGG